MQFSVPANTMSDGKLMQLFIALTVKNFFLNPYLSESTLFLRSLKGCPFIPADSFSLNKEQFQDHKNHV